MKKERYFIIDEQRDLKLERGLFVRSDLKRDIERIEKKTGKRVAGIVYDGSYNLEFLMEDIEINAKA